MRRANGTGTITRLSGDRRRPYAVRVPCIDRRGHIQQKYLSYHASAREAQQALDEYNRQAANGIAPPPDKLQTTLADVYALWSARKYAKAGPSSVASYKASWARLCTLGSRHMRDITLDELQAIIDRDQKNGLSKSSIQNDKTLMTALFRFAMERDIVMKDYSAFVEMPTVGAKFEKGAFTDEQLRQIEQLSADGFPYADTVLILCYTGFRVTEFLTLKPDAYDPQKDTLCGGLKTDAGRNRIVPVHPKIKPCLQSYLKRGGKTIICTPDGKPISSNKYRSAYFQPVMRQLGTEQATPHWTRHTFASLLHAAGAPELDIKRLMGHADKNVTEHYTHLTIDNLRKAVLLLD